MRTISVFSTSQACIGQILYYTCTKDHYPNAMHDTCYGKGVYIIRMCLFLAKTRTRLGPYPQV